MPIPFAMQVTFVAATNLNNEKCKKGFQICLPD